MGSATALAVLAAATAGSPATLAGNLWDGGGNNNDWSTSNNWNPNGAPANDGTAPVTFAGSTRLAPNLNQNWSILSLTFDATAGAFVLGSAGANTLTIGSGGIAQNDGSTQTINHALALSAAQTWSSAGGALAVGGAVNLGSFTLTANTTAAAASFTGAISGTGGLSKTGNGTLTVGGAAANTYVGATTVSAGVLQLGKSVANGAIAGNLTIGDGVGVDTVRLTASNQIADAAGVAISQFGVLDLQSFSETIGNLSITGATVTGTTGTLALGGGTLTQSGATTTATIQNVSLQLTGGNKTFNIADGAAAIDLDVTGPITQDVAGRSILKSGAGTLRLAGANSFSGMLEINGGTVILANNAAAGTGQVAVYSGTIKSSGSPTLANNFNFLLNPVTLGATAAGETMTITGQLSGAGPVTITDGLNVRIAGAGSNLNTNTFAVTSGTLTLAKPAPWTAIGGTIVVGDDSGGGPTGFLVQEASNQIGDSATVQLRRSGVWDFGSAPRSETIAALQLVETTFNTGTNTLTVTGNLSASSVTPGGATSTLNGNLNLGGGFVTLTVGGTTTFDLNANVSNGTLIYQFGGGVLNLGGTNSAISFRHGAVGGRVNFSTNSAFGTATVHVINGGAPHFFSPVGGARTLANNFSLGGEADFDTANGDLTLNGLISGAGALAKYGTGTLTLANGGNSYSGATTVNAGKVVVTANNALGATTGGTTVNVGGVLELAGVNYTAAEPLTLNGGGGPASLVATAGANTFAGAITLNSNSTISANGGTLRVTGPITGNGGGLTLDGTSDATYSGNISGAGVGKTGAGVATLTGTNTIYTLGVSGGTLRLASPAGSAVDDMARVGVYPGGTLEIVNSEWINRLAFSASGYGSIVLGAGATLTVGGPNGSGGIFGGAISGAGSLQMAGLSTGDNLTLSGVNTFTGPLIVAAQKVTLQGGSAVGDTTTVQLGTGGGTTLDVQAAETIGGLSGGGASGGNVTLSGGALTVGTGGGTYNGVISGNFGLNKLGGADLALGGINTFTGKVSVSSGGRIGIVTDAGLGAVPGAVTDDAVTLDNGALQGNAASVTIHANRGITLGAGGGTLRAGNAQVLNVPARITGATDLTIDSAGSTPATIVLGGVNTTFTGKTTVNNATLSVSQDANLSAAPGALVPDKLTLTGGGTLRATASFGLAPSRGVSIPFDGGTGGGAFEVTTGQTLTVPGTIIGQGNLTKRGSGSLALTGNAQNFTGRIIVDAGTLVAQQDASLGGVPGSLVPDAITIKAAALRWNGNGSPVAATRGITLGAASSTISVDAGVTMVVNAPLAGPGGLQKTGPGTLGLFGGNSYAATTSVGAGRLVLNQSFSSNASVAVSTGATLELAEAPDVTLKTTSITVSGKVDVKDNKVVLTAQPIGAWNGTTYSGVTGMIRSAYNGGAWNGNGLTTTMPDAATGLTTLAVSTAEQANRTSFGGVSVAPANVLVMYTYAGDANLDGAITGDDYSNIDLGILFQGMSGYANGDFNYDGVITGDDYSIIDLNILLQGPQIPSGGAAAATESFVTAVPEPSACGFALLAAAALSARQRRRRRSHPSRR